MPPLSVLRAIVERNIAQVRELQLAGEKKKRSRRYRHGGFHPKPHQPVGEKPQDKWRRRAEDSPWYEKYLENPETYDQNSWYGKRFAELFIVPRLVYDELLEQIRDVPGYCDKKLPQEVQRWVSFAGTGKQGGGAGVQPLELKLLASLMRLRGTKFKVIEESACISALCLERFHYAWLAWYAENIYPQEVYPPEEEEDIATTMDKYDKCGLPGAICGIDATHVDWTKCPSDIRHLCKGKEGRPTVMFNVAGDLNRRAFHIYGPDYGARNDKTAARFDGFMQDMYKRKKYADVERRIYGHDGSQRVLKGAHAIVDGGYHLWHCLVETPKVTSDIWLSRFGKRIESARKPSSECIFGVVKRRFGCLTQSFQEAEMSKIGDTFRVCFALHNVLLRYDGLHTIGERASDWNDRRKVNAKEGQSKFRGPTPQTDRRPNT